MDDSMQEQLFHADVLPWPPCAGLAFLAGRLSYTFGLSGPCIPINTACSSSLVAVHLAARAIHAHDCDMAVTAGTNAIILPLGASAAMTQVGALSPDGRCKAFAADADGYGRGEGVSVAFVESELTADASRVLATLASCVINQDGRSSSLTAPHGPSQQALVQVMRQFRPSSKSWLLNAFIPVALNKTAAVRA